MEYGDHNNLTTGSDRRFVRYIRRAELLLLAFLCPVSLAGQTASGATVSRLMNQNRLAQAEQELWTVLTGSPDECWALDLLAEIRVRQKREPEAEALLRKALTINPQDARAYRGLGEMYQSLGKSKEAIESYTHAVALTPKDISSNTALAGLYQEAGQYRESVAAVQRIPATLRAPQLLPVLAADYFGMNEPSKVPALIPSVLRQASSSPRMLLDFVTVLIRNGYVRDADRVLTSAKPAKPGAEYLRGVARVREAQGRVEAALQYLSLALKLEPRSFDLLFDSARLAAQGNRWEEMLAFLRRADDVQPDRPEVWQKLSLGLLKAGHRSRAVAAARKLNVLQPDNLDNQYVLALALIENDLQEEAEPIARKLAEARPQDANSVLLLAIAEFKKGDTGEAKRELQRCLAIDPHSPAAHYYSALIARREGNVDAARAELEEVVRMNPSDAAALAELGTLYLQIGLLEKAKSALEQAVKLDPRSSQYHYHLGLTYVRLGLREAASKEMETYKNLRQAEDEALKPHNPARQTPAPAQEP